MAEKSFYDSLGVSEDASESEIKKAYRKLVRQYHPDVSDDPNSDEKIAEINNAYETLRDPEKRAEYDAIRASPFGGFSGSGASAQSGFKWEDMTDQFGEGAPFGSGSFRFDDIFSAFSGGANSHERGSQGFGGTGPIPGQDQHAEISVSLSSVYEGDDYNIKLNVPTRQPNGTVTHEQKTLKIRIPKGITEGKQIRLSGQGAASTNGGKNGDLFLKISINHPDNIRIEEADVYQTVNITPWEAALGDKINVETPTGILSVTVPKNSKSGSHLRIKGKGIPAKQPGDLFLTLNIVNPDLTTDAHKQAYKQLKASFADITINR